MAAMAAQMTTLTSQIAVAAIDFGTTYTGCAYYLRKDSRNYVNDINVDQAWPGSSENGLQAPTTVLIDPDKKFHSFGFEAEAKYKLLTLRYEHMNWFYFRQFKMCLHHEKELHRDFEVEATNGHKMNAMIIFTEAIRYVKNHILKKLKDALKDTCTENDVKWVLTVPAIWRESAKQFMREAASNAGIPDDKLTLALEPESAAIFCKELAMNKAEGVEGEFLTAFDPGEKYIVVDLGGGTVDTTGHRVEPDGSLVEIHAASGGPWGGELVNDVFTMFIEKLVTPDVLKTFRTTKTSYWLGFLKDFEKKKRSFSESNEGVEMDFPIDLEQIYKETRDGDLREKAKSNDFSKYVELIQHSLIVKKAIMLRCFEFAIDNINNHLAELLSRKELKTVSKILLVGGFSESPIVSNAIKKRFKKLRVIAPGSASMAILKGAVMFGIDTRIISSRISPYTYGVHTRKLFDKAIHPSNRRKTINGKRVVDYAFDKHIEKQQSVYITSGSRERTYRVSNRGNHIVFWNVYQSDELDPVFCNDDGCRNIGKLAIRIPDSFKETSVTLKLGMTCQGTELHATAQAIEENHVVECTAKFDFFEKFMDTDDDIEVESIE